MKLKSNLKDKYYIMMLCSLFITVLWTWYGYNKCVSVDDEILLIIYALGFMLVPYLVRHYHLLDAQIRHIQFNGGKYCFYYYQQ